MIYKIIGPPIRILHQYTFYINDTSIFSAVHNVNTSAKELKTGIYSI